MPILQMMKLRPMREGILFHFWNLCMASSPPILINPLKLPGVLDKEFRIPESSEDHIGSRCGMG